MASIAANPTQKSPKEAVKRISPNPDFRDSGNPHWVRMPDGGIDHLPGDYGPPIVGHTFTTLRDPLAFGRKMYAQYGPIYRTLQSKVGARF